jgi:hypothetical protein
MNGLPIFCCQTYVVALLTNCWLRLGAEEFALVYASAIATGHPTKVLKAIYAADPMRKTRKSNKKL